MYMIIFVIMVIFYNPEEAITPASKAFVIYIYIYVREIKIAKW